MFLAHVNDIWRNTEFNIRLFANVCIIHRKIMESGNIYMLQTDLNSLGEWEVENELKVNRGKSKGVRFKKAM
jgi:hypothetical protein